MVESPEAAIVPLYVLGAKETVANWSTLRMSLFIFLSRLSFSRLAAARCDDDYPRYMGSGAVEIDRSGLYVERAVDDFVGRVELHLDLASIGVDSEGLMLGEYGWSEDDSESQNYERFHYIS